MDYKNSFRISINGDTSEHLGWELFVKNKFPNYDIFWANFIAPNTRRPIDIWFKDETPNEVRILSMLHYGIFTNFFYIYNNLQLITNFDKFTYSYIKLSSILDLTEEFLLRFYIYTKKLDTNKIVEEYGDKNYIFKKNNLEKQLEKACNLSIPIKNKLELMKNIFSDQTLLSSFKQYANSIRSYRNILIHSWPLFVIDTNKIPKKELVLSIEYRDWTVIVNKLRDSTNNRRFIDTSFIDMKQFMYEDTEEVINVINKLWLIILNDLNTFELSQHK
ncbi:MAG: hypothetical protein WAV51_01475 [Microgenomates group bacterium]